jgi:predicted dithiol-disulfide oxidoreductase (DUF899 family)
MSETTVDEAMIPFVMPNAGDEYARARQALLDAEFELREHVERVAAQRRKLPVGPLVKEYEFFDGQRRSRTRFTAASISSVRHGTSSICCPAAAATG